MKILIDNGHGAKDLTRGKFSPVLHGLIDDATIVKDRFREGEFNRLVARSLVSELKSCGYDVELVVPEDTDVSLKERCRRVNAWCKKLGKGNVILVSIHANALGHGNEWYDANYWTVWTCKGQTTSDTIATYLWKACKEVMPDMKFGSQSHQDGDVDYENQFYILVNTSCPAVLTENFFYTNKENLRFLTSASGRSKIVEGHKRGIINYLKSWKEKK